MKDLPLFTTENGVASLTLREIPYRQEAYIRLQATEAPTELLEECRDFCRACGAEHIYAAGHSALEGLPLHYALWQMQAAWASIPKPEAYLWPVLPENASQWQELYNRKMAQVPGAHYMTNGDVQAMLEKGDGYFVHADGTILGIGRAYIDRIDAVAAAVPGAGAQVVATLCSHFGGDRVMLEVASTNARAIRLYEKLGFVATGELERWYKVL